MSMQRTCSRTLSAWLLGSSVALAITACSESAPTLPPLLLGVSEGGGSRWGACPARNVEEARLFEGAEPKVSPELEARLAQSFPVGSREGELLETLRAQGFELLPRCEADNSVRSAKFAQPGQSLFSPGTIAEIYWQVDQDDNILWTHGFVRYVAL